MKLRLTYAFKDSDEVHMTELETLYGNLADAYKEVLSYIEQEHQDRSVIELVGISLLVLPDEQPTN